MDNIGANRLVCNLEIAKLSDGSGYDVLISTDQLNRNGWQVDYKGWELDSYRNNPVVMWGHDYLSVPVGRSTDVQIDKRAKGLAARFEFRPAANDYDPIHPIMTAWEAGFLRAASVGFLPLEYEPLDENSSEWFGPFRSLRQDLLEWSIVPIPADPNTLRKNFIDFSRGLVGQDEVVLALAGRTARVFAGLPSQFPTREYASYWGGEIPVNTTLIPESDTDEEDVAPDEDELAPAANVSTRSEEDPEDATLPEPVLEAMDQFLGIVRDNL